MENLFTKIKNLFNLTVSFVLGTDVSYWNGNGQTNDLRSWINWSTMSTKVRFSILRGVVNGAVDTQFERNWINAKLNKQPIGVYIYLNPQANYSTQVDNFIKCLNQAKPELGGWVDVETNGGLSPTSLKNYIKSFIQDVQSQVSYEIGIYTRGNWWNENVARDSFFGTLKLWVARYSTILTGPWSDDRYRPLDWNDWTFWQYSAYGIGVEYGCPLPPYADDDLDLNYYNGTDEEFVDEFNLQEEDATDLEMRVEALEAIILDFEERIITLEELVSDLLSTVTHLQNQIDELNVEDEYITLQPIAGDKAVAYVINYINDSGYPVMKTADPVVRYDYPDTFQADPEPIRTDGAKYFYKQFNEDLYYRSDKVTIIGD